MYQPQYYLDTTFTKLYVGGLPWKTRNEGLRNYFQQFGEIIHSNVVVDKATDRSQGFGFVTFRYAESATRACLNPEPIIDGRKTSCKLASSGRGGAKYVNQFNPNPLRPDDLCNLAPRFCQYLQQLPNQHQPLVTADTRPYCNNYYPLHTPLGYYYPQQSFIYNPQYYSPYNPEYGPGLYCPATNTYFPGFWLDESTNAVARESNNLPAATAAATLTDLPSETDITTETEADITTPSSSPTTETDITTPSSSPTTDDSVSSGNQQSQTCEV